MTVFAYDTAVARGGYIFFPKDVNGWSSVSDNYMAVTGYKNGTAETETAKFTKKYFDTLGSTLRRGFYTYTVDEAGFYKVNRLDNQKFVYDRTELGVTEINGATYFNGVAVASDCKVVDTRTLAYLTSWDVGIGAGMLLGGYIAEIATFKMAYLFGAALTVISLFYFRSKVCHTDGTGDEQRFTSPFFNGKYGQ